MQVRRRWVPAARCAAVRAISSARAVGSAGIDEDMSPLYICSAINSIEEILQRDIKTSPQRPLRENVKGRTPMVVEVVVSATQYRNRRHDDQPHPQVRHPFRARRVTAPGERDRRGLSGTIVSPRASIATRAAIFLAPGGRLHVVRAKSQREEIQTPRVRKVLRARELASMVARRSCGVVGSIRGAAGADGHPGP